MSFIVSQYDPDEEGTENRINFWLKQPIWTASEAALLFLDIDPHSLRVNPDNKWVDLTFLGNVYDEFVDFDDDGFPLPLIDQDGNEFHVPTKLEKLGASNLQRQYLDYLKLMNCTENLHCAEWIDIARVKGIDVPWIGYAVSNDLVKLLDDFLDVFRSIFNEKDNPMYPNELVWTIQAWANVSKSTGKRTPKQRLVDYLEKNSDLSQKAIKRCSEVANWNKLGGAPKTGQNN